VRRKPRAIPQVCIIDARRRDAAAIAILAQQIGFDLVILDLNLPRVGAVAFLERYHKHYPPIVVFTSSWNPADEKRALGL
jgi:CheY-like chemotaxis protein